MEIFDSVIELLLGVSAYTAGVGLLSVFVYTNFPH